ncbi:MAG: hypothetical protein IMZ60_02505 [Actinobacteria bacterium]|nr:hypothetical protein [Actinomycetota bacterium]
MAKLGKQIMLTLAPVLGVIVILYLVLPLIGGLTTKVNDIDFISGQNLTNVTTDAYGNSPFKIIYDFEEIIMLLAVGASILVGYNQFKPGKKELN